jgi:hypothetical protein
MAGSAARATLMLSAIGHSGNKESAVDPESETV